MPKSKTEFEFDGVKYTPKSLKTDLFAVAAKIATTPPKTIEKVKSDLEKEAKLKSEIQGLKVKLSDSIAETKKESGKLIHANVSLNDLRTQLDAASSRIPLTLTLLLGAVAFAVGMFLPI